MDNPSVVDRSNDLYWIAKEKGGLRVGEVLFIQLKYQDSAGQWWTKLESVTVADVLSDGFVDAKGCVYLKTDLDIYR